MIPLGILASSVRSAYSELLAPTDLVATLVEPTPIPLPEVIGEPYGGGFYAGDIQYQNGQWYKLIVAPIEADVYGLAWGGHGVNIATVVDDGLANTTLMVSKGSDHYAAEHCFDFRGGGNDDWYLPATSELNIVYQNLGFNRPNCPIEFLQGGAQAFDIENYYWSSEQASAGYADIKRFSDGALSTNIKRGTVRRTRPIRRIAFTPPPPLPTVIGEPYGGGFYGGDIQYPDGQWYKLIVAPIEADVTDSDSRWSTNLEGTANTSDLFDGRANTASMVTDGIDLYPAAKHCTSFKGGGNSDWYMPAKNEMNTLQLNLGPTRQSTPLDFRTGAIQAFSATYYWTSSQRTGNTAWVKRMTDGNENYSPKNYVIYRVRPVRRIAFTPPPPPLPTVIGEPYGGGYYIGDITVADGGADDGVYAVIMAGADAETSLAWKTTDTATAGTGSLANGLANTLSMQAADPSAHPAGMYCLNYTGDDHDDWYLPAKDELNLAWLNRADLGNLGMKSAYYRASTQNGATQAHVIWFGNGANVSYLKKESHTIRPVRRLKRS